MANLTNPASTDENEARKFLEASRWPDGPVCPFCGQHPVSVRGQGQRGTAT
ncbi:MAG: transposase [Xanthobacteraceae bacterium]|jgi:hypothetical protein